MNTQPASGSGHRSFAQNLGALPRASWVLFAGTFVNRFGTFVMPMLAIYLTRSGYSIAQTGIAISAYGGGHIVTSILGGHLADRFGRRNTIALSMFASGAAMLALSQARGYAAIVACVLRGPAAGAPGRRRRLDRRSAAPSNRARLGIASRSPGFAGGRDGRFLADRSFLYILSPMRHPVGSWRHCARRCTACDRARGAGRRAISAWRDRRFVYFRPRRCAHLGRFSDTSTLLIPSRRTARRRNTAC